MQQRQRYKDDLNAEDEEYWNLHTQIDKMKRHFRQFHEQQKSLTAGSKAYQAKKDKTVKAVLHHSSSLDSQYFGSCSVRQRETAELAYVLRHHLGWVCFLQDPAQKVLFELSVNKQ